MTTCSTLPRPCETYNAAMMSGASAIPWDDLTFFNFTWSVSALEMDQLPAVFTAQRAGYYIYM